MAEKAICPYCQEYMELTCDECAWWYECQNVRWNGMAAVVVERVGKDRVKIASEKNPNMEWIVMSQNVKRKPLFERS